MRTLELYAAAVSPAVSTPGVLFFITFAAAFYGLILSLCALIDMGQPPAHKSRLFSFGPVLLIVGVAGLVVMALIGS